MGAEPAVSGDFTPAPPRIVGIDLSLVHTGVACDHGELTINTKSDTPLLERIDAITDQLMRHVLGYCVRDDEVLPLSTVVLEGPSFGSKGRGTYDRMQLLGVLSYLLWQQHIPVAVVPPRTLKKFATSNGNADKTFVVERAIKAGYEGHDHNEADAWWLRRMGVARYGGNAELPGYQLEALGKVAWP